MEEIDDIECCGTCGSSLEIASECRCGEVFCNKCFNNHLIRMKHSKKPQNHGKLAPSRAEVLWAAVMKVPPSANQDLQFKQDEHRKWFGLYVEDTAPATRTCSIIETNRLRDLLDRSLGYRPDSPRIQYPSIASFVGDTGAGKSFLIRSLLFLGAHDNKIDLDQVEAPVIGRAVSSGDCDSTTGEVNLYSDPCMLGTATPSLLVDCEGMFGTVPAAMKVQNSWFATEEPGRKKYRLRGQMGRKEATQDLYPRLLYTFSDVVCYVTTLKTWVKVLPQLLDWSTTGAQHSTNQAALPALIIILNRPGEPEKRWLPPNAPDALTNHFFGVMEKYKAKLLEPNAPSIWETTASKASETLGAAFGKDAKRQNERAQKYEIVEKGTDDKDSECISVKELLLRSYSNVHVHYVPWKGELVTPDVVFQQIEALRGRIRGDSKRVQELRAKSGTRFNHRQFLSITHYGFSHFSQGLKEPFDFGVCRQQTTIPDSIEGWISGYLEVCWGHNVRNTKRIGNDYTTTGFTKQRFDRVTAFIASSILKDKCRAGNQAFIDSRLHVFHEGIRNPCVTGILNFLDDHILCSYVDECSEAKCCNTKNGHAKGHQTGSGGFLHQGEFLISIGETYSDESKFITGIERKLDSFVAEAKKDVDPSLTLHERHKTNIRALRTCGAYPGADDNCCELEQTIAAVNDLHEPHFIEAASTLLQCHSPEIGPDPFSIAKFCYGCLFRQPEYRLPCGHLICGACLKENRNFDTRNESTIAILEECVICGSHSLQEGWPFVVPIRPHLTNPRVLSLDGGGVRGIVQLVILERLEHWLVSDYPSADFLI
ncbi:hypothetical protein TWF281_003230 [Arthrobotrys megalospora]